MPLNPLRAGALLGAVAVGAGAFGAHALRTRLDASDLAIFETAVRYQMYHALALVLAGSLTSRGNPAVLQWAARLFVAGIVIFSGSLYALVLTGPRWLGAITPIGGVALMSGWVCLSLAVASPKPKESVGP